MKLVFSGLLVHERMCSIVSVVCMIIGKKAMFTNIAKLGDSALFFSLYVGGTPLYLRTRNISNILDIWSRFKKGNGVVHNRKKIT